MSTRSSYFLVGPFHLYYEHADGWIHLAIGGGYPDFAPKILPGWKWIDRPAWWIFVGLPWRLWERRRFLARERARQA